MSHSLLSYNYLQELICRCFSRKTKAFFCQINNAGGSRKPPSQLQQHLTSPGHCLFFAKTCSCCEEMIIIYIRRVQVRVRLFTTSFLSSSDVGHAADMKCIIALRRACCLHGLVTVSNGYTSEVTRFMSSRVIAQSTLGLC